MITVKNAGALNGYSSTDHLIDTSAMGEIIGKQFRSVGSALKAADKRCWMDGCGGRKGSNYPYTWVVVMFADKTTKTFMSA